MFRYILFILLLAAAPVVFAASPAERPTPFSFADLDSVRFSNPPDEAIADYFKTNASLLAGPHIFTGYQTLQIPAISLPKFVIRLDAWSNAYDRDRYAGILYSEPIDSTLIEEGDEILIIDDLLRAEREHSLQNDSLNYQPGDSVDPNAMEAYLANQEKESFRNMSAIPSWLSIAMKAERRQRDLLYGMMVNHPASIDYTQWDLPVAPTLPDEDFSFAAFINSLKLPAIRVDDALLPKVEQQHINWLHSVGGGIQFSQAFISSNWYQGGNNYLALLFNFNWNATLNTIYHPNLMFVSDLSYKLAINSNPKGAVHKYSISQDQFQYTLKTGVKAFNKWFYSLNLLFKTQLFTSFAEDSHQLKAKFLSPAEFNLGLGMTYNTKALKDRLALSVSIAPLSYNLKACPSMKIEHTQFNILPDRKTSSQFGSNAELNLLWNITDNISWKSRLFLFTNYHYFQGDWENTFNFAINKFLSTQLYIYPRFDSSSNHNPSWGYWQLKEILSFGLSYTFTTKP